MRFTLRLALTALVLGSSAAMACVMYVPDERELAEAMKQVDQAAAQPAQPAPADPAAAPVVIPVDAAAIPEAQPAVNAPPASAPPAAIPEVPAS